MPLPKFPTAIAASSYLHPSGGEEHWEPLRRAIVERALNMGYDLETMAQFGVNWAHDQDPYGHVANFVYSRYFTICNMRVMESFGKYVGEDVAKGMLSGKGIGMVARSYHTDLRKAVSYPDQVITANRISEIKPDRFFGVTTVWSLAQQAIVAECRGYLVFFDFDENKPVNLIEKGGVWKNLYDGLVEQAKESNKRAEQWEKENSKKAKL